MFDVTVLLFFVKKNVQEFRFWFVFPSLSRVFDPVRRMNRKTNLGVGAHTIVNLYLEMHGLGLGL